MRLSVIFTFTFTFINIFSQNSKNNSFLKLVSICCSEQINADLEKNQKNSNKLEKDYPVYNESIIDKKFIKKIKTLKRNANKKYKKKYIEAYKYIIQNLSASDKYESITKYCVAVNYLKIQLVNSLSPGEMKEIESISSNGFHDYMLPWFFTEKKIDSTSIKDFSSRWTTFEKLIRQNLWIDKNKFSNEYYNEINSKVFEYYFEKIKGSKNFIEQNKILDECLFLFPQINIIKDINYPILKLIVGGKDCDGKWANGKINLFEFSYLSEYFKETPENSNSNRLINWLKENQEYNFFQNVKCEKLNFNRGKLIDTLNIETKSDISFELILDFFNEIVQINIISSGEITKSRFFDWLWIGNNEFDSKLKTYEYRFKDGKNLDFIELEKNIELASDMIKNNDFNGAMNLLTKTRQNNFPDNIIQNKILDVKIIKLDSLVLELKRIENEMYDGDQLIENKRKYDKKSERFKSMTKGQNFEEAFKKYVSARNNQFSNDLKLNKTLDEKIINVKKLIQEKELDLIRINKLIQLGIKLFHQQKFEQALETFKSGRENEWGEEEELNVILDDQIIKTQRKIDDIERLKKLSKFENELRFTKIGKVEISKEYLKVDKFTNGDKLEFAATSKEFVDKTISGIPVYCYYNFESKFADKGYYYNVFAINDLQGRKLLSDDYRLPFKAEITYINSIVNNIESKKGLKKRLLLQDYIFSSNNDLSYNGYMDVHYQRKNFNFSSSNEIIERDYSKNGWLDENDKLQHVFWILNDFDFGDYVGLRDDYTLFEINYNLNHYSKDEGIPLALCQIPKEISVWDYQQQKVILNDKKTTIKDNLNNWSKEDFNLFASQIKVVKKRHAITKQDWLPNSISKKLKFNIVKEEYGSPKKVYSTIQYATDEKQWMNLCNKEIPACASFEFNSSNDSIHGLVYNRFVFTGNNFPLIEGSKTMELIDLLDLKYSFKGNSNEFFNLLFDEHNLKLGGRCYYSPDESSKKVVWQLGSNNKYWNYFGSYNKDFGYIPLTYYNIYNQKDLLILKLYSSYNGSINQSFFKPEFEEIIKVFDADDIKRFDGFSLRFLKNK
jgi:hypothetical protein